MYMETRKKERIKWIDCAKAVAIVGVVIDHCNGVLYKSPLIAQASYFAVSLFVILSGISAVYSISNKAIDYKYQFKRVENLYLKYAVATFLLLIWYYHFFDLKTYITYLLNFSIEGAYYFLLFFSSYY